MPEFGLACRADFRLDYSTAQLNHGSFGATPLSVRDAAEAWRRRMEADPTHFVRRVWPEAVAAARAALALGYERFGVSRRAPSADSMRGGDPNRLAPWW